MRKPTLYDLYETASVFETQPRVHGNGFLQFDLSSVARVHIWDDRLPRQTTPSSIHDHAFGIESTVLCGKLIHMVYDPEYGPDGRYDLLRAQAQPGTNNTILEPTGERCDLKLRERMTLVRGDSYYFPELEFHDTDYIGTTATIMLKRDKVEGYNPRVLVLHGHEPDNEFDREGQDQDLLWEVIRDAFEIIDGPQS